MEKTLNETSEQFHSRLVTLDMEEQSRLIEEAKAKADAQAIIDHAKTVQTLKENG